MKNVALAVSLLTELLRQAAAISTLVRQAQTEGRDLTAQELDAVQALDDASRANLVGAIERAKNS
jgi:hypothetical protein